MRAVLDIAGVNLVRFVRDRSFVVLAIVAPFLIMTALAGTLGSVFSGQYRPDLVIADEIGIWLMFCTPAATTMSAVPLITACAAK